MKTLSKFLTLPFRKWDLELQQQESWREYLYDIEWYIYNPSLHAQAMHGWIDWYVDYGTEVYSPIDWYAMASYNYSRCYDFIDGKPSWNIRSLQRNKLSYGLGYAVQLYSPTLDIFLLYWHFSYLSNSVWYTPPKLTKDDFWNDMRSCSWFALNKELRDKIDKVSRAKKIRKWDYIWDVWLSWLHIWGEFPKKKDVNEAPRTQNKLTPTMYTDPHLHMNLFTRDENWKKNTMIDPYDIFSTSAEYPLHWGEKKSNWGEKKSMWENTVFIVWENWLPLFISEQ